MKSQLLQQENYNISTTPITQPWSSNYYNNNKFIKSQLLQQK